MAHWAQLDNNNIVVRVVNTSNDLPNEGYDFIVNRYPGTWVKTSYNAAVNGFRKNYAAIGGKYDAELDAFLPVKPFPSWVLNEENCTWESPVPFPTDLTKTWAWDEETQTWNGKDLPEGVTSGNA